VYSFDNYTRNYVLAQLGIPPARGYNDAHGRHLALRLCSCRAARSQGRVAGWRADGDRRLGRDLAASHLNAADCIPALAILHLPVPRGDWHDAALRPLSERALLRAEWRAGRRDPAAEHLAGAVRGGVCLAANPPRAEPGD